MSHAYTLYNHTQRPCTAKEFNALLYNKTNLVFLFIGVDLIIGSYYSKYFTGSKLLDPKSFVFTARGGSIVHYLANPSSEYHAEQVTGYLVKHGTYLIGEDGLTLSQERPKVLEYSLPSESYNDTEETVIKGEMELENFIVMTMSQ